MKKILLIVTILSILISLYGCNSTETDSQGGKEIAEAEVIQEGGTQKSESSEPPIATVEPGGKVVINETIKNQVLAIVPGLTDYKAGDKLTDQMKFKFVYYGYSSGDLSKYTQKEIDVEGKKNTWALIPKAEVDAMFKEVFGVDLGEYKPALNEDDPTVYFANDYYYVCTSAQRDVIKYTLLKEGDSVVKIKEVYEGDERYNEINVTLQTANNSKGYVVTEVLSVPK